MLRVVAYDIGTPKRLRQVARVCLDYGIRVEKSVFECNLDSVQFAQFWAALNREIDPEEDSIIAYPVCHRCEQEIRFAGIVQRQSKPTVYVF